MTWAKCMRCEIDLPPHAQIRDLQRRGDPVAQGHLCGRRGAEYYLCTHCLGEKLGLPYPHQRYTTKTQAGAENLLRKMLAENVYEPGADE